MTLIGMTICSGIGAPEVAAPWVDWALASEIETFPREVLADRFGYRDARHNTGSPSLWGDFTALRPRHMRRLGIPLPDIIVAGTPCQAFSVAGLRKGLGDERGNLTLQFVRTCNAIVNARPDGRLIVLWENVPGVLSDRGNAFGAFLGGMVGAMDAIHPHGDTWGREGMVQGPRARAAWAVLDAQWFGVAQRRRRVFALFDFGGTVDPAAVLFERDSLRGHTPPRREARQDIATTISARTAGGCGLGTDFDCDGGLIAARMAAFGEYVADGTASTIKMRDYKDATDLVAHSLRAVGFDASEDGTGRGTPPVPMAFAENSRGELRLQGGDGAVAPQLTTGGGKPGQGQPCIAFDCRGSEVQFMEDGSHPTLRTEGNCGAHPNGGGHAAVATAWAVRRLTPRECERLQGFPDDHTLIRRDRKRALKDLAGELTYLRSEYPDISEQGALRLAADGPRYKALGNSMAVPVVRWIMNRIRISHNRLERAA
ncbi:DNA cytosine methyltransferase [Profundibacter sp.]